MPTSSAQLSTAHAVDPSSAHYQQVIRPALERIEGWLAEPAAHYTAWLMAQQNAASIPGGIVEFGVYRGRYLALLYLCGRAAGRTVVGIDLFAGVGSRHNQYAIAEIRNMLLALEQSVWPGSAASGQLEFLAADTLALSASEVTTLLGPAGAAYISVDGGHEAVHLVNDLELAAELLAPDGIVAVDDAFNYSTPGAIEGTCRWFDTRNASRLAPFAHCYNKLFLCRTADHARWLAETKQYLRTHASLDFVQRTTQRMNENANIGFTPRFFDQEIVPFL